jgi:exonuclease
MSSQAEKLFKNAGFIVFEPNKDYKDTFKRVELRWNCHVVMPPSISGYGFNYQFVNGLPMYEPKEIPSEKLLAVLERFGFNTSLNHENIIKNIIMDIGPSVRRYSVYQTLILAFDIETTGLAKNLNASYEDVENWPYIVQIGYQIISGFGQEVVKEGDYILRPKGFTIPESSTSIHGISNSDALNNGWNRRDFYNFFVEQLRHIHYLVVHNSDFDINVLKCELLRYTDLSKDEINHLFNKLRIICTMKKSTELCKIKRSEYSDEYKYPSLNELYKFLFGKKIEDAHNAKNDARATVDCFIELSKKGIIRYCKNKPIYLNFWSENEYCTCCYGKLKQSSCPIPEWDRDGVIFRRTETLLESVIGRIA